MRDRSDVLAGVILGTAVGDALGLPREGMSTRRAGAVFGGPPLRHRFLFGHGMTSDDTEHTCLLAQALLRQPNDADCFSRALAWGLRGWLLGIPAGIGKATLKACLKLWLGFPPSRSGVWSAGNGPAMRSALLGVCLGDDLARMSAFVRASTRLTHTDPRAEYGALLVALVAHYAAVHGPNGTDPQQFLFRVRATLPEIDARGAELLDRMEEHLQRNASTEEFAAALGLERGVNGFVYHTVPVSLYAWLRSPGDFRRAVEAVIALGGDADTTGAITGAIAGATVGTGGIPREWLKLWEWPRSTAWMRRLADRLARAFPETPQGERPGALRLFWPALPVRNLLFLAVVLGHVVRRGLPPYL
jgi:ADP-ribosylglycohydrolase